MKGIIFLLLCLTASIAQAKTLYVDINNGSDRTSYADNSSANPWASLGRAAWGSASRTNPNAGQAARAGDVVIVRAGTYHTTYGTGERYDPIYNPVNSGRSGSPITFRAQGDVHLTSSTNTHGEPIIGAVNRRFIVWDGFRLNENNIHTKADTGPVAVWGSDNITLQNLTVRGNTSIWNDNHNAIRIENSHHVRVRNSTLSGTRNPPGNRNGSGITLYGTKNIVVENNEMYDTACGVFIKGHNDGPVTVRYNYFHDLDKEAVAVHFLGTQTGQGGARIYQNIVRNSTNGFTLFGTSEYHEGPSNVDIVNNTIYNNSSVGIYVKLGAGFRDIVIANNIVSGSGLGLKTEDPSVLRAFTYRNNLYHNNDVHAKVGSRNYDYAAWRNSFRKDTVGSLLTNPGFSDTSGNTLTLSANSRARRAGVDILNLQGQGTTARINMGARVTGNEVIGVRTQNGPQPVNFEQHTIQSYGGAAQDVDGTVEVRGSSLTLTGNNWKRIAFPYTVTRNTVVELDFMSNAQGDVQGIGFDVDNAPSYGSSFKLYGTDAWGIRDAARYTRPGQVQRLVIPVGQYFTGRMRWLTFINDHDVANPMSQSRFSNVRVYEASGH
jgi:hypothetical protein